MVIINDVSDSYQYIYIIIHIICNYPVSFSSVSRPNFRNNTYKYAGPIYFEITSYKCVSFWAYLSS
jgi:hypothetical protein